MFRSSIFRMSSLKRSVFPTTYSTSPHLATDYRLHFIRETFKKLLPPTPPEVSRTNLKLKQTIVLDHCLTVEKLYQTPGTGLARLDDSLSNITSLDEKLGHSIDLLTQYDPRPTMTFHPTNVFSDSVTRVLRAITADFLALKKHKRGEKETKVIQERMAENIRYICNNRMLPDTNLTPEQEIDRQNEYYLYMMEDWPKFYERVITRFAEKHAPDKRLEIKKALTAVLKRLFRLHSWGVGDIDGNLKKSAKSMSMMVSSLQIAIIRFYRQLVSSLIDQTPKMQSIQDYLERCEASITDNICFDVKSSERAKKRLIALLDNILVSHQLDKNVASEIAALRDYVDLIGFRGDIKQYIRQSSMVNDAVFDNFAQILSNHHEEIKTLLTNEDGKLRNYTALEMYEKERLYDYLRTDSKYFATLKQQAHQLTAETIRELDIFSFVTKHKDLFSYILSDTKNTLSLRQVATLFAFSAYRDGELFIDQIRQPPMALIPLCETSDDLARLPTIFKDMLDDPYLRESLIEHGEFVYVPGPSDLGRESGEFAHINLIKMYVILENLLKTYQKQDPRLLKFKIRPLYGLGGDSQRRISESFSQLFATFQGSDAYRLAGLGAFTAYIENTAGQPSENIVRAHEFNFLEEHYPEENQKLNVLIARTIQAYKNYNENPVAENLFRRLTFPQLGAWFNTTSRGESKSAKPKDIIKSRAIGLVNYEALTRIAIRRIMSADGLVDLPPDIQAALPTLYEHSAVIREIVLKTITSIATSHIPRAWIKLRGEIPSAEEIKQWANEFQDEAFKEKQEHHALAYLEYRSHLILQTMTLFLPALLKQQSKVYFENHPPLSGPSHTLALDLLEKIGEFHPDFKALGEEIRRDILPRYAQLEKTIESYEQTLQPNQTMSEQEITQLCENVVLAFRGDSVLPGGPVTISGMRASEHNFSACGLQHPLTADGPQQAFSSLSL